MAYQITAGKPIISALDNSEKERNTAVELDGAGILTQSQFTTIVTNAVNNSTGITAALKQILIAHLLGEYTVTP